MMKKRRVTLVFVGDDLVGMPQATTSRYKLTSTLTTRDTAGKRHFSDTIANGIYSDFDNPQSGISQLRLLVRAATALSLTCCDAR